MSRSGETASALLRDLGASARDGICPEAQAGVPGTQAIPAARIGRIDDEASACACAVTTCAEVGVIKSWSSSARPGAVRKPGAPARRATSINILSASASE